MILGYPKLFGVTVTPIEAQFVWAYHNPKWFGVTVTRNEYQVVWFLGDPKSFLGNPGLPEMTLGEPKWLRV